MRRSLFYHGHVKCRWVQTEVRFLPTCFCLYCTARYYTFHYWFYLLSSGWNAIAEPKPVSTRSKKVIILKMRFYCAFLYPPMFFYCYRVWVIICSLKHFRFSNGESMACLQCKHTRLVNCARFWSFYVMFLVLYLVQLFGIAGITLVRWDLYRIGRPSKTQ